MSIRILKAHLGSKGEVSLKYQEFNETTRDWGNKTIEESEPALDSFQASLDALKPMVRKYRQEGVLDITKYNVTGITFIYGKTESPGADAPFKVMIASHRNLDQWGPATCNTPRLQVTADSEDATCVTDDEALKVEAVMTEAIRYIEGERKQMPLPDPNEEDGEDELPFGENDNDILEGEFEVVGGTDEGVEGS